MKLYFHVRAGADFFPDTEGCEAEDLAEVQEQIRELAQEFEMPAGEDWSFEIADAAGRVVLVVPFSSVNLSKHN